MDGQVETAGRDGPRVLLQPAFRDLNFGEQTVLDVKCDKHWVAMRR